MPGFRLEVRLLRLTKTPANLVAVCSGAGEESAAVRAMRALPQQQQVALCAAAKLLGPDNQGATCDSPSNTSRAFTPPSNKVATTVLHFS